MSISILKRNYLPWFMWLLPLAFFTYQFILRLWPSLMMQPVMRKFGIDATAFGLLASVYYYGYAGMQIPLAICLDRFGVRRVVFICTLMCACGVFLFSSTQVWGFALFSRFLIGMGSAVGFLATSKVIAEWFPHRSYGRMVGLSFTIGLFGAIYGGAPTSVLIAHFGERQVSLGLAIVALFIGFFIYAILRTPRRQTQAASPSVLRLSDFKQLFSSKTIWWLAIANLLMVGSLEGFADVWGVNYLMVAHHLAKSKAAEIVSFIFVGMLFGGPLLAFISKKCGLYRVITGCGMGMAIAFFGLILFRLHLNIDIMKALFFSIGVLCCYQVLIFAAGHQQVRAELFGVVVAFLNSVNMLGGSFFHTSIGWLMDLYWQGTVHAGLRVYTLSAYHAALLMIPCCALIGAMMVYGVGRQAQKGKG